MISLRLSRCIGERFPSDGSGLQIDQGSYDSLTIQVRPHGAETFLFDVAGLADSYQVNFTLSAGWKAQLQRLHWKASDVRRRRHGGDSADVSVLSAKEFAGFTFPVDNETAFEVFTSFYGALLSGQTFLRR